MIREIKFRFFIEKVVSMVSWEIAKKECDRLSLLDKDGWIPMQFTGLTDSGGVEIYEGDIVEFTYWWFDGNEAESKLTGTIVYSNELMSFQLKGIKNKEWERHTGYENDQEYLTAFSELNFTEADFEVIGNIHENSELLK